MTNPGSALDTITGIMPVGGWVEEELRRSLFATAEWAVPARVEWSELQSRFLECGE